MFLPFTLIAFGFLASWHLSVLLTASIVFYTYGGFGITAFFLVVAGSSYRCFVWIRAGRRWELTSGIFVNLLDLFTFE